MDARRSEAPPIELGSLGRDLMQALPGGAVYVESDGSMRWANNEALRMLGLSFDELSQRDIAELAAQTVYEDGSPCPADQYPVSLALRTGEPQTARTIGVRLKDGSTLWAVFSALPVKDPASGAVKGAVVTFLDITDRKRAEEELKRSRDLLRTAQKIANVGSWELDLASGLVHWTEQMYEIHGIAEHAFRGGARDALRFVHPDDVPVVRTYTEKVLREGVPVPAEYRIVRPDGAVRTIWGDGQVLRDEGGRPYKVIGAIQDVTERRALEDQLRQSQRMESIGRLAGGIAHDFNNLLQVILGNADIALRDPTRQTALVEIKMAAQRAAELTRQLLAFGRRQPFAPADLDLKELIGELTPLLRRMLGERVGVDFQHAAELAAVSADRGQIEQVLINLCINARDAMPDGGKIAIRLDLLTPDERFRLHRPWAGGAARYAVMCVTDSGSGMEPEVRARAFEPFFTTKDAGSGTGLGLAVVFGIVQQHRGEIEMESSPGGGTSVRVYLPALDHAPKPAPRSIEVMAPGGSETLLVVEDEVMVQKLVVNVLKGAGYRVLAARDGHEALRLFEREMDRISLVLVDMIMPGMSGRELERKMHAVRPKLHVLYTTGYAADPVEIAELGGERVLYKPYDRNVLLNEIRAMLDKK